MELRKQEQRSRQLMKQITQMESDKNVLQENVTDAETALHTVAKLVWKSIYIQHIIPTSKFGCFSYEFQSIISMKRNETVLDAKCAVTFQKIK